ncbi:MAG: hypothetical protein J0626_01995, partial [Rhodospirillaceae bacterium]|nr:hypothetical protein [Rhodospirillaceae bacterium]
EQKLDEEAYAVAAEHIKDLSSDPEFLMNALSLRFSRPEIGKIDADVVASYSATIAEMKSAPHSEILGWYAYNSRQFEAAEAWPPHVSRVWFSPRPSLARRRRWRFCARNSSRFGPKSGKT